MIRALILATAIGIAAPVAAQAPAPTVTAPAPDPVRLTAARKLMDQLMPVAGRDEMIRDMMQPMIGNIRQSMTQSPQFQSLLGRDPRAQAIMNRFMDSQLARTTEMMRTGMPGMIDAMSRAYARRLTVSQMAEIGAFFATPTGQVYLKTAPTIMSDPDVSAWMRQNMTKAMADMPDQINAMVRELSALEKDR